MRRGVLAVALAVFGPVCGFGASEPAAVEIVPRVQAVLRDFFASLPSFICIETVDSETLVGRKVIGNTHVVSSFTGIQQRSGRASYTESRKKLSINGKPVPAGAKEPRVKGVFHFGGGFSSVLHETFSPESALWQRYRVEGTDRIAGEECILLAVASDDARSTLSLEWFGKEIRPSSTGRAWISRESMKVLKLERHYSGLPHGVSLHVSVDYATVTIGTKEYLMPRTVRAWTTASGSGRQATSTYTAVYSDYRKFDVASDIKYSQ